MSILLLTALGLVIHCLGEFAGLAKGVAEFHIETANLALKTMTGGSTSGKIVYMNHPEYTISITGIGESRRHLSFAPIVSKIVSESQAYQDYVDWDSPRKRLMYASEKVKLCTIHIKPERGRRFKLTVRCNQKSELDLAYPNTAEAIRKFATDVSTFEYDMSYKNTDSDNKIAENIAENIISSLERYVDYLLRREKQILLEYPDIPTENRNAFSIRNPLSVTGFELMYIWSDWMYHGFNIKSKRRDVK